MKRLNENPKRAIRNITDLGKRFSKGSFQNKLFTIIQEILEDENSPYYSAMQSLLNNTSSDTIKNFGINIGYNSLIIGSEIIRKYELKNGNFISWVNLLDFDESFGSDITIDSINTIISKNKSLGMYTYIINQKGFWNNSVELFDLFSKHNDCSFVMFLEDNNLSDFQLDKIKNLTNLMLSINVNGPNSHDLISKLSSQKSLYSMHYFYDNSNVNYFTSESFVSEFLSYKSVFLFLLPKESASEKSRAKISNFVYSLRLNQKYPLFIMDLYSDINRINNIISKNFIS